MQLAIVKGRATATIRHPSLTGQKLLVCQTLDAEGNPSGDPMLVLDHLGAGTGDTIMISSDGLGLRERVGDDTSPARWFTLGIIDNGYGAQSR